MLSEVQRSWSFLENLFIHSDEVKKELPKESIKFVEIDKTVRDILKDGYNKKKAIEFSVQPYVLPGLENVQKELTVCEKALNEFMDSKRMAFPRFYFVSPADLLDILSNGNAPEKVMEHMPKIISAMDTIELKSSEVRPYALGMHACVGKEYVKFTKDLSLMGKVEVYLQDIIDVMRSTLKDLSKASLKKYSEIAKKEWLLMDPAQVTLLINCSAWVILVEKAFQKYAGGNKKAIGEAYDEQANALKELVVMVQGDLDKSVRQKIMCLITMDAHSRDIIKLLENEGVTKQEEFQW
jgi:dynein heavy chain